MSNMIVQATYNKPRCTAKTAEIILSKYRPIAPKPETHHQYYSMAGSTSSPGEVISSFSRTNIFHPDQNIMRQAPPPPYLMNYVWAPANMHEEASRPIIRTCRKRGRTPVAPPTPPPNLTINKRPRTHLISISPSYNHPLQPTHVAAGFPAHPPPPHQQFVTIPAGLITLHDQYDNNNNNSSPRMVTLPLLPSIPILTSRKFIHMGIDLNKKAPDEIPEERDFLQQLQGNIPNTPLQPTVSSTISSSTVIGTSSISQELCLSLISRKEEVERLPLVPVVVSDSNYRMIRVVNSAYKEMVGLQPECLWLESCASCNMISGEIGGERVIIRPVP